MNSIEVIKQAQHMLPFRDPRDGTVGLHLLDRYFDRNGSAHLNLGTLQDSGRPRDTPMSGTLSTPIAMLRAVSREVEVKRTMLMMRVLRGL